MADVSAFQPMDIFELQWAKDPQISPNGEHVVYVRHGFNVMSDDEDKGLWIIDVDGASHEPLTSSASHAASPRWSPDGDRIAYVSDTTGTSQIHIRWLASGRDIAITNLQSSPGSLAWSPDGTRLAFIQFVAREPKPIGERQKKPEGARWKSEAKVFEDSFYRSDSSGFLKPGRPQIFVVSADGGIPVQLTEDNHLHMGTLSWTPDGDSIYFSSNYNDDWQIDRSESDLFRVGVKTLEVTRVTDRDGPDSKPAVSPDGKWLAYIGSDDDRKYQDGKVYLSAVADHQPRLLFDLDRSVSNIVWSSDSKAIYFSYVDKSVAKVGRADLKGRTSDVASGLGGSAVGRPYAGASFSVSSNGLVAHDLSLSEQPANVAVTKGKKTRQLTNLNRDLMTYRNISDVEEIWFDSSHDGLPIQGWLIKPPGFDPGEKYPLMLEIHGGPYSAYGDYFSAELQLYAAAGYVVLYTNPRGSTSYGREFAQKIHHDYPGNDYDDLMSGVDAVIGRGYIDEENLFVTGGSGGGILTAWIVTKTDRFRAAVSQKPVINWFSLTFNSDIGPFFWPMFFEQLPWEDPAAYLAKSPISEVHKVKTPTMLLTGENDLRTPMSESEQFYQALQLNGVETALVRIQDSTHSISKAPSNLLRKVSYVLGWFDRHQSLGSEDPAEEN